MLLPRWILAACFVTSGLCVSRLRAQGATDYLNLESPRVRAIAVARVATRDFVLACNTPDNAVEIFDAKDMSRVARIGVGQEPVSVVWSPRLSRFYTANMVGDSVSVVRLGAASVSAPLDAVLERTVFVGDEPMCVAFGPGDQTLFVTHNSKSAISWHDPFSLQVIAPGFGDRIDLLDDYMRPRMAIKEPRAAMRVGSRLFVLGFRGGHSFFHDLDLWSVDFATGQIATLGGLGTIKHGFAADPNGDLWVVAADAQNQLRGVRNVAKAPTGFVTSLLHRVIGAGTKNAKIVTRDLNADASGKPVARARSLAHPTDIVVFRDQGKTKLFLAAFHSDRIGIVEPRAKDPAKWVVRVVNVPLAPGSTNTMAGPRSLALKPANPQVPGDPGARVFVLNRLDNSVAVFDPVREKIVTVVPLAHDPTPLYIRRGRRLLYSAKLSGNGFVGCASCHLDGHTDGLAWDLSEPASGGDRTALPRELLDGVTDSRVLGAKEFPMVKGRMVTQPLQGLLNWEVDGPSQFLFSNAPRHWRGDTDVQSFNAAYVKLQGMKNLGRPNEPRRGVSVAELDELERFLGSISYPPNPEQPFDRRYSGSFGDPDKADGSGGLRGLKLFHTVRIADGAGKPDPILGGRSCAQCHFLPEGSNNRITRFGLSSPQPMETAQLRGLLEKEATLEHDARGVSAIRTNEFGTEHQGTLSSINDFNEFVFGHDFGGVKRAWLEDITRFVREFDTGVAPIVGFPLSVDRTAAGRAGTQRALDVLEQQVREANAGLAVRARLVGKVSGYWFDPILGRYRAAGATGSIDRTGLLARLHGADDLLVFEATPLGNERRIASPTGATRPLRGSAPSRITLEAMRPNTAYRDVPTLTKNWKPGPLAKLDAFAWTGVYSGTSRPVPEPTSLRALRLLQYGRIQDAGAKQVLRHEAPRRFRVAGLGIRHGAKLILYVPNDPKTPPPYTANTSKMIPVIVPLYATGERTKDGRPIWESAAEADATLAYTLTLGGPAAPGVAAALSGKLAEPPAKGTFQPARWNRHWVWVRNADGTYGTGGWQALRLDG